VAQGVQAALAEAPLAVENAPAAQGVHTATAAALLAVE
jgi:hypothetical protein